MDNPSIIVGQDAAGHPVAIGSLEADITDATPGAVTSKIRLKAPTSGGGLQPVATIDGTGLSLPGGTTIKIGGVPIVATGIPQGGPMTVDLAAGTHKITGLGNATADADALNRVTADARYDAAGAATTAQTNAATYTDTHVATEATARVAGDTTTLASANAYTDGVVQGIQSKTEALASNAGVALPAYDVSGGGTTITGHAVGAFPALDTVTIPLNSLFFLRGLASPPEGGVWKLTSLGSGGTSWIAVRPTTDTAYWAVGTHAAGFFVFINQGPTDGGKGFVCNSVIGTDVIGTHDITFVQFSGAAAPTYAQVQAACATAAGNDPLLLGGGGGGQLAVQVIYHPGDLRLGGDAGGFVGATTVYLGSNVAFTRTPIHVLSDVAYGMSLELGSFWPTATASQDLGTSAQVWRTLYATTIDPDGAHPHAVPATTGPLVATDSANAPPTALAPLTLASNVGVGIPFVVELDLTAGADPTITPSATRNLQVVGWLALITASGAADTFQLQANGVGFTPAITPATVNGVYGPLPTTLYGLPTLAATQALSVVRSDAVIRGKVFVTCVWTS